jgi:hypothetical protein
MAGPWEKYGQPQPAMGAPSVIQGPPKTVDPAESERLRLAQEADARSAATAAREAAKFTQEQQAREAGGNIDASGEQRKAAGFYNSAFKANREFEGIKFQPRDAASEMIAENAPQHIVNSNTSPERQQALAFIGDFIRASLRLESGAAIGKEEYERQYNIFFPQPGDAPETMAAKARLRQNEIESLKLSAGPAASLVAQPSQAAPRNDAAQGFGPQEQATYDKLTPEQKAAWSQGKLFVNGLPLTAEVGSDPSPDAPQGGEPAVGDGMRKFLVGTGDVVQGVGNIAGLVANPLNAGLNMTGIPQALTGEELGTDLGQSLRDSLGFPRPQGNTGQLISQGNQLGAGALTLSGAAGAAAKMFGGATGNALARYASQPLVDTVSGFTGGGSSELARQHGAGPIGQTAAGFVGGAVSIPAALRAESRLTRPVPIENALARAGREEGVTVNRAMVDPSTEGRVTGVESTMAGGIKVRRDMRNVGGQIERGVQRLGRGGDAMEQGVAGNAVKASAERFIHNSGKKFRALYNRAEQMAGGEKLQAPQANQILDELTARLSETGNTNKAELGYLAELKGDLSKPVSVGALRDLRTTLRKKISKGELVFGQNEARVLDVMDALSRDIEGGLVAANKGSAAAAFKSADAGYRERMEFINSTVQKIIGKRGSTLSPGAIFENFRSMATPKGDHAGLAKMIRQMDPEEQADIAATFADALGKNGSSDFSTAHFITQAGKLPPAARVNLFGQDGAKSIDNLLLLAKEHKRVVGQFNNSKTGRTNDYRSWLNNLVLGGGGGAGLSAVSGSGGLATVATGALGAAAGAVIKGARDVFSARALMSPEISKWITTAPRTASVDAINAHFNRLGNIAARSPGLAEEVARIQQGVMKAANENATRAAASEGHKKDDRRQ